MITNSNKKYLTMFSVFAALMLIGIGPAEAFSMSEFKTVISDRLQMGKDILILLGYFFGTVLLLVGLGLVYKNQKEPGRDHGKHGMIAFLVAGALFSITAIADLAADVTTGTQNGSEVLKKKTL
ncbi:hypothetical protein ACTG16_21440 [Aeromonas sp. 23P]|uniref:hypothetical protein n=1 Tax=Aeromonas sp. 23P TaxID=3452716 RepID=UPI003F78F317|nr:hypothetical protein [Aeromonas veronii]